MTEAVRIAEVYLCRGHSYLILQYATGRGRGFWMVPGGAIKRGEAAEAAARRELFEETGLVTEPVEWLRTYRVQQEGDAYVREISSFIVDAPDGDITLIDEHTAFAWITPAEYVERYCSEAVEAALPAVTSIIRELRASTALAADWMARRAAERA